MKTEGKNIKMFYSDFGVSLPITITNVLETDVIKFRIYNVLDELKIEKTLPYSEGKWILQFTEEESKSLIKSEYWYEIVQYRNGELQNTINKGSLFEVR